MRLKRDFFKRDTVTVAKQLLGKYIVCKINGKTIGARITETEAYCGVKDKANHASKGLTERTKTMFGPPGYAYIYLVYGMYHCFNVVTREEGCPEAVLIRKAEIEKLRTACDVPLSGTLTPQVPRTCGVQRKPLEIKKLNGPGILCRELKIDKRLNGADLCVSKEIWVESASRRKGEKTSRIKRGKRIGVDYAGKWKDKLWRFYVD